MGAKQCYFLKVKFVFVLILIVYNSNAKKFQLCPKDFKHIGPKCYYFSESVSSWDEAHFNCHQRKSSLVVIVRSQQQFLLSNYINRTVNDKEEYWIDGRYNWKKGDWYWGASGHVVKYNAFPKDVTGDYNQWHCIVLDPSIGNQWNSRNCVEKKRYICQKKMNAYIDFNWKLKKYFNISKCGELQILSPQDRKRCIKLLGDIDNERQHPNEPAPLVHRSTSSLSHHNEDNAMCSLNQFKLGSKCYTFSKDKATYLEAFQNCKNNHSALAQIRNKKSHNILRAFLNRNFSEPHERWISGSYDWHSKIWKLPTGKPLSYYGFDKNILENQSLEWAAIILDPKLKNRWNIRRVYEKKHYICQTKPKGIIKYDARLPDATIRIS